MLLRNVEARYGHCPRLTKMDEARFFVCDTQLKLAKVASIIQKLPLSGQMWDVSIKPWKPRRSVDANRRLWSLHKLASEATGHSVDEMHEWAKMQFLPRHKVKVGEREVEVPVSSARLNKKDFGAFMEAVESFYISELGVFMGDE